MRIHLAILFNTSPTQLAILKMGKSLVKKPEETPEIDPTRLNDEKDTYVLLFDIHVDGDLTFFKGARLLGLIGQNVTANPPFEVFTVL